MQISINSFNDIDMIVESFEASSPAYWDEDRYLIMTQLTLDNLLTKIDMHQHFIKDTNMQLCMYHGYRIAIDNGMNEGIIEIR